MPQIDFEYYFKNSMLNTKTNICCPKRGSNRVKVFLGQNEAAAVNHFFNTPTLTGYWSIIPL